MQMNLQQRMQSTNLRSHSAFLSDKKNEYNDRIGRIWDVATRFYNESLTLRWNLKLEATKIFKT